MKWGNDINAPLDSRFGRSPKFLLYDLENGTFEVVGNQQIQRGAVESNQSATSQ
jgi:predicted Fe-Mo cluster-binding NifX family protein